MNVFPIMIIFALIFSLASVFYVGYTLGDGLKDKRICSAWYEQSSLNRTRTFINATVFDNGTILTIS